MCEPSNKGKKMGPVDKWLESLGFYRKNVAYDETCLFRAASEQLFDIQLYHEKVRNSCINYAQAHSTLILKYFEDEEHMRQHLEKLRKHIAVCGMVEIQLLAAAFECNVKIFYADTKSASLVVSRDSPQTLMFCFIGPDHFDTVYLREKINNAAFCQAMVYKTLYENIFGMQRIDETVNYMLYNKHQLDSLDTHAGAENELIEKESEPLGLGTPFPYKIAKALDPQTYRNIEYDSWGDVRRSLRLGDWYYGDGNLTQGTKCIYRDEEFNKTYHCYIQDMLNGNKCDVYITELAQRRTVEYSSLSPESDAKPWPLPYRLCKNSMENQATTSVTIDKTIQNKKKKPRNRFRNGAKLNQRRNDNMQEIYAAYVGAPLVSNTDRDNSLYANDEQSVSTAVCTITSHEDYSSDQDLLKMSPFNETPFNSNLPNNPRTDFEEGRRVATSCRPNDVVWNECLADQIEQESTPISVEMPRMTSAVCFSTGEKIPERPQLSLNMDRHTSNRTMYSDQFVPVPQSMDHSCFYSPITAQINAPMGLYSPMFPVTPYSPIVLSPSPAIPAYGHPLEYIPAEQCMYSSPASAGWYPSGVNSQGFIFPPPNNVHMYPDVAFN